jgi:hypothetical protein
MARSVHWMPDAREDLIATLAASRELTPEHDVALADALLDRWHVSTTGEVADEEISAGPRWWFKAERMAALLSGATGIIGIAYVVHAVSAAEAMYGAVRPGLGMSALDVARPFALTVLVMLCGVVAGASLHTLRGLVIGRWLLFASTGLLALAALRAVTYSGSYLTALLFSLALAPGIVPLVAIVTVLLAVTACVAAVVAERTRRRVDSPE